MVTIVTEYDTSASERGEKDVLKCMFASMIYLTVCGVENYALMVVILLMKCMAKSSTVRVDEGGGGGGGGGQRKDENVLKSM